MIGHFLFWPSLPLLVLACIGLCFIRLTNNLLWDPKRFLFYFLKSAKKMFLAGQSDQETADLTELPLKTIQELREKMGSREE